MKKLTGICLVFLYLILNITYSNAQLSLYQFSQDYGRYSEISPSTIYWQDNGNYDDNTYSDQSIGFTFNFNGTDYTSFGISINGYIQLGSSITSTYTGALKDETTSLIDIISILSADLYVYSGVGTVIGSVLSGEEPYRVLTIQWKDVCVRSYSGYHYNFQIKLYETENRIEFVYGPIEAQSDMLEFDVGLRGESQSDFSSRYIENGVNRWDDSYASTDITREYANLSSEFYPSEGLTYSWFLNMDDQEYTSSTSNQVLGNIPQGASNQAILQIEVIMNGFVNPLEMNNITCNTNGTSNTSDVTNAKLYYTGNSSVFSTNNQFGSTIERPDFELNFEGRQTLSQGSNYFWLVYDLSPSATIGNIVDGECTSITISGNEYRPDESSPRGYRDIVMPLSGEFTVGNGGNYSNLTEAFNAINSNGLNGAITLTIISDIYETTGAVLSNWIEVGGSGYSVLIHTDGLGAYTIYGNATAMGVLNFINTHNVTIDGGNDRQLSIVNNNANFSVGVLLTDGSTNSTIENTSITTAGGGSQFYGIYLNGLNNNYTTIYQNIIDCNSFGNYGSYGVYQVGSNQNLTIYSNEINDTYYGIYLSNYFESTYYPGNSSLNIVSNSLNGVGAGVYISAYNNQSRNVSIIQNDISSNYEGIVYQNYYYGNYSTENLSIVNNSVNSIYSNAIYTDIGGLGSNIYITSNTVTNAQYNGINSYIVGSSSNGFQNVVFSNNIVSPANNIFNVEKGIRCYFNYISGAKIYGNKVNNLTSTSSSTLTGIDVYSYETDLSVENNDVHSLSNTYTNGGTYGINISGGNGVLVANNIIYDIKSVNYSGTDLSANPFGIRIDGGSNHKIYYNSVNLFGNQNSIGENPSLTSALCITSSISGLKVLNNIFANSLTGAAGTQSYSIYAPSGITFDEINNNDYFASGSQGVLGYLGENVTSIERWRALTEQDEDSKSVDPLFTAPNNLKLMPESQLLGEAEPIEEVTSDILNKNRSLEIPTIGAYEYPSGNVPRLLSPSDASFDNPINPTLTWFPFLDAVGYHLQLSYNGRFTPEDIILEQNNITDLALNVPEGLLNYNTIYHWRITATANGEETDWSNVFRFTTVNEPYYCTPGAENCYEYINSIQLSDFENISECGLVDGYSDYSSNIINLLVGQEYTLTVFNAFPFPADKCGAWVDWNNDKDFYEENESIPVIDNNSDQFYTATFLVEAGVEPGEKRIRTRIQYGGTPDPCEITQFGEVEDYTLSISYPLANLIYPSNNELEVPLTATFTWQEFTFATNYKIYILSNPLDPNSEILSADVTSGSFTIPEGTFEYEGDYYWYVVTTFEGGYTTKSETYKFKAQAFNCYAGAYTCDEYISRVVISNIDNSSSCIDDDEAVRSGYADYKNQIIQLNRGVHYRLTIFNGYPYSVDECGVWVDWNNNGLFTDEGEQIAVDDLYDDDFYTSVITPAVNAVPGDKVIRMRIAYNVTPEPCGFTSYGEVEDYTLNISNLFPATQLIAPENRSTDISFVPVLQWEQIEGANGWKIQISEDPAFSSVLMEQLVDGTTNTYQVPAEVLNKYSQVYYWRVQATNDAENAVWSAVWSFATINIPLPEMISPENESTNVSLFPEFSWNGVQYAQNYTIYVYDHLTESVIWEYTTDQTSYTNELPFKYQTSYCWIVVANQFEVSSTFTNDDLFHFTTIDIPVTSNLELENGSCIDYKLPTFEWSNIEYATGYNFEMATDAEFNNIIYSGNFNTTSFTLDDANLLEEYTQYFWRVQVLQDENVSLWSDVTSFNVSFYPDGPLTLNLTDKLVCKGSTVDLGSFYQCGNDEICNTVTGGSGRYRIQWYPTTGLRNSSSANPTVIAANVTRTYTIRVTDLQTNQAIQGTVVVTVHTPAKAVLPQAMIVQEGQSINLADRLSITGGTQPFEYSWRDAYNSWYSTDENPNVSPEFPTRYYLTITDANGCLSNEATVYIYVQRQPKAGEFDEELAEAGISYLDVYPNPTSGDVNLNANFLTNSNVEIKVTNLLGQEVYIKNLGITNAFEGNIDLNNVPAGIYILQISVDGKTTIKKIIKQ